eukprot:163817-Chlamydomonas_euryale.AAC.4
MLTKHAGRRRCRRGVCGLCRVLSLPATWCGSLQCKWMAHPVAQSESRVRVSRSLPDWVCLCRTKQAIKDNLQLAAQARGGRSHQPNLSRPHRTNLHPVPSRCLPPPFIRNHWTCKQL